MDNDIQGAKRARDRVISIRSSTMCQSAVYMLEGGEEREIKRDVILVEPVEGGVRIQGFFESPTTVPARIAKIDLLKHRIILEPIKEG